MSIHSAYALVIDSTIMPSITRQAINTGTQVRGQMTSGSPYVRQQSIVRQTAGLEAATLAIAAGLDLVGVLGESISGLTAGVTAYFQAHASEGLRATGSNHRKYVITGGVIAPTQLTCNDDGDAELTYAAVVRYDGVNAPIVITDSVALPALGTEERFGLGAWSVGGVDLTSIKSLTIDFGLNIRAEPADGEVWPTRVDIRTVAPVITLTGIDIAWAKSSNIPLLTGKAATHANTIGYLRKRDADGTYVADVTAEHVKFTAAGLAVFNNAASASGEEAAESSIQITCDFDGTNAPIVVDTSSAIT